MNHSLGEISLTHVSACQKTTEVELITKIMTQSIPKQLYILNNGEGVLGKVMQPLRCT